MIHYIIHRFLVSVPLVFALAAVDFLLPRSLAPGDPAQIIGGKLAWPQRLAEIRVQLGLDQPLPVQFAILLGQVAQGDLGRSNITNQFFAHKLFEQYAQYGSPWVKRLFLNGLNLLLGEPLLRHGGPSTLVTTVAAQAEHRRWIVHLLHYIPQRRARCCSSRGRNPAGNLERRRPIRIHRA